MKMTVTMPREEKPEPKPKPPAKSWWLDAPREGFSAATHERLRQKQLATPTYGQRHKDGI